MKTIRSIFPEAVFYFLLANLAILILPLNLKASHSAGGEITYKHIQGDEYKIILKFVWDCKGAQPPVNPTCTLFSNSCGLTLPNNAIAFTLYQAGLPKDIYSCSTNSNPPCYKVFNYETNITLPLKCSDWTVFFDMCCRNNSIGSINNPGSRKLYLESVINNKLGNNNSPVFAAASILMSNINIANTFSQGVTEVDGDQLLFELIPCKEFNTSTYQSVNIPYLSWRS